MIAWEKIKNVHLTGIKGVGMTALACCLKDLGIKVVGSDTDENFVTDQTLRQKKISCKPFSSKNITGKIDLLIFGASHKAEKNPEVKKAQRLGIITLTQAEILGKLMSLKDIGISVCGVGGKTTTASLIASLLESLKANPSFSIGVGKINNLKFPGRFDKRGKTFIVEADEYLASLDNRKPKFLFQNPKIIVLTNLAFDHPDFYHDFKETKSVFQKFFQKLPSDGLLIIPDDPKIRPLLNGVKAKVQTFGFTKNANWQITDYDSGEKLNFAFRYKDKLYRNISLSVPGKFNMLNSLSALAVTNFLGYKLQKTTPFLKKYKGSKRRFEKITEVKGRKIYDDYAHHPVQIKNTLEMAKNYFKKGRIWAIFQPHTFSRTKALFKDFCHSFSDADYVIIAPIFASAREKNDPEISGKNLKDEIAKFHSQVFYHKNPQETVKLLQRKSRKGDIILTLGAGDIYKWHLKIIKGLKDAR